MPVQSTPDSPRPDRNERHHLWGFPLERTHILRSTWYSPAGCSQSIPTSREAGFRSGQFALAGIQPLLAQAQDDQKKQIAQIESQLHGTVGLIAYNRPDYTKSIEE